MLHAEPEYCDVLLSLLRPFLAAMADRFAGEGTEELLGVEVSEMLRGPILRPEAGEVGMSEQVLELPRVHHFGPRYAVAAAMAFEVLARVDALVVADRDTSVVVAVAVDDLGGREVVAHDALLPHADVADDGIVHVEPVVRPVVGHRGLLLRALLESEQELDFLVGCPLLLDQSLAFARETIANLVEHLVRRFLEETRGVEATLLVLESCVRLNAAGRGDHVAVAARATTSVLAPPTDVERRCVALAVDRSGVERLGIPTPAILRDADVRELRVLILLRDLADVGRALAAQELQFLIHVLDLRSETVGGVAPRANHLADRDLTEKDNVLHGACRHVPILRDESGDFGTVQRLHRILLSQDTLLQSGSRVDP